MESIIKKIVSESVNAPSGDNCQPWVFSVKGSKLCIYKRNEGNNDFLDFRERGTLLAHGALIENITIVASHYGYKADISVLPSAEENCTAIINFSEGGQDSDIDYKVLYEALPSRCTNRKEYKKELLSSETRNALKKILNPEGQILFVETEESKEKLFNITTQMERIALQNKFIHKFFFDSIVWSEKEERKKMRGLYLKTMELPLPVQAFFRILRYWPVTKILSKIGFSKKVAESNARMYQSSTPVIFSVTTANPASFVAIGRVVERFWLLASHFGVAVHPLAGVLYIYQRMIEGHDVDSLLTKEESLYIKEGGEYLHKEFIKNNDTIAMILRIGYSEKPSAISSKRDPEFI